MYIVLPQEYFVNIENFTVSTYYLENETKFFEVLLLN